MYNKPRQTATAWVVVECWENGVGVGSVGAGGVGWVHGMCGVQGGGVVGGRGARGR